MTTRDDPKQKLFEILKQLDTVMMITDGKGGLFHGRPMAVAEIDPAGELWFVTSRDSEKAREVLADARAVITGQQGGAYVSVSGRMDVVLDPDRVHRLWREAWRVWFPKGKEDTQIVFMRLRPEIAEYWSTGGAAGIRYLFEAAKALIKGERPHAQDPEQHGKVRM